MFYKSLILCATLLLGACGENLNITLENNINLVSTDDGLLKTLSKNDIEYKELETWLKINNTGWQSIEYSELPNKYIISDNNFFIVSENNLILAHKEYVDKANYFKKPIKKNEFIFLR